MMMYVYLDFVYLFVSLSGFGDETSCTLLTDSMETAWIQDRKPCVGTTDWSSAMAHRERRRQPSKNTATIRATVSELGQRSLNSSPSTVSRLTLALRISPVLQRIQKKCQLRLVQ